MQVNPRISCEGLCPVYTATALRQCISFGCLKMAAVTVFLWGLPYVSVRLFVTNDWEPVDGFSLYFVLGNFTRISYRILVCLKFYSSIIFNKGTKNIERKLCSNYEASILCSVHFYASFLVYSGTVKKNTLMLWVNFQIFYIVRNFPVLLYFHSFSCTYVRVR